MLMTKNAPCCLLRLVIAVVFVSLAIISRDPLVARAQTPSESPVLLTRANSTRAIALESVTFTREPFSLSSSSPLGSGSLTRVILFAQRLILQPGENPSAVTAFAQDDLRNTYTLAVEDVGPVLGQEGLSQVIVRLSDEMNPNVGDLKVRISYRGLTSNSVTIRIGPRYALAFSGSPQSIWFAPFFAENVDLGPFFWELWAMPEENNGARYMLSDGYGGAHALLFGFSYSSTPRRYALFGNIYDGTDSTYFASDDGPAPGEWGHFAVGWDGRYVTTYYNGVPVGRTSFDGPRRSPGPRGGAGPLYIGGSSHSNFIGRIAQVRGYEGRNPQQDNGRGQSAAAFTPQTIFEAETSSLLVKFLYPSQTIADLSGNNVVGGMTTWGDYNPPPQFAIDPAVQNPMISNGFDLPRVVPSNPRIFDSFSRPNATYAFDGIGGLGSTEAGFAGRQTWRFGGPDESTFGSTVFGILTGRAVVLSNGPGIAWVPTNSGSGDLDVQVDRQPGSWGSGIHTGLAFRVLDGRNFFFVYTGVSENDPFNTRTLTAGYYINGSRTNLVTGVNMPANWITLRVVTKRTGEIAVYANDIQVYATSNTNLTTSTGVGLYNDLFGLALTNRWDNFTVLDAPE